MFTVEDLSRHFKMSPRSISRRLSVLGLDQADADGEYVTRGRAGKYLVTQNGLAIFNRLLELERKGYRVEDAAKMIRAEIRHRGEDETTTEGNGLIDSAQLRQPIGELLSLFQAQLNLLFEQLKEKDEQIRQKDRQIEYLHDLLQRQLPPPKRRSWFWWRRTRQ